MDNKKPLNDFTVIELKEKAKSINIKGYSKMNKSELILFLSVAKMSGGGWDIIKKSYNPSKKAAEKITLNTIREKCTDFTSLISGEGKYNLFNPENVSLFRQNNDPLCILSEKNCGAPFEIIKTMCEYQTEKTPQGRRKIIDPRTGQYKTTGCIWENMECKGELSGGKRIKNKKLPRFKN